MRTCPYCGHKRRNNRNTCTACGRIDREVLESIQISPAAHPTSRNDIAPRQPNNSFEKGIRRDERGVPYLDKDSSPLRMKESFNKKDYEPKRRESIKVSTGGNS